MVAVAVLAAFSVRRRWRLGGLLLAGIIWTIGTGLWGEFPWPRSFEVRVLAFLAAALLAVGSKRFTPMLPAVLLLWLLGAWGTASPLSLSNITHDLHQLTTIALAGVGLAAFARLASLAWSPGAISRGGGKLQVEGWKAVSVATGLLLVVLVLTLVLELTRAAAPLGLEPPLGLLIALAEAIAGICLWRATVQTDQLAGQTDQRGARRSAQQNDASPARWTTTAGLMAVFIFTGLAFALVPVVAALD